MIDLYTYSMLTVLGIGLVFGFMIGMIWYYPTITKLRMKIKDYLNK